MLKEQFDFVIGTDTEHPQTKANILEICVKEAWCTKGKAVLLRDGRNDEEAARVAGIDFMAVTYSFGFREKKDAGLAHGAAME